MALAADANVAVGNKFPVLIQTKTGKIEPTLAF